MMNKYILLFLLVATPVFSQKIVSLIPLEAKGNRFTETTIGTATLKTFEFHFSGRKDRNPYSGFVSVVVWADTSVSGALPTTVTVSASPMFYDAVSDAWEVSAQRTDSLDVEDAFNISTSHSDNVYSVSKALNILGADGLKVYIYNTHATLTMVARVELRLAEDSR